MREASEPVPSPAKMFPRWTDFEQDFWLDRFEAFADMLLEQFDLGDPDMQQDKARPITPEDDWYIARLETAAKLADRATMEMIFRFERQKPIKPVKRARRRDDDDRRKKPARRPSW